MFNNIKINKIKINQDYINLVQLLFKGQIKFKILEKDPTITQMTTLQNYLQNLCNRGEISKAEFNQMRPKNVTPARTHGLPKIHKTFTNIWDSRYSPSSLFVNGYKYVSFDVESLFTIVPIKKTIDGILTQI